MKIAEQSGESQVKAKQRAVAAMRRLGERCRDEQLDQYQYETADMMRRILAADLKEAADISEKTVDDNNWFDRTVEKASRLVEAERQRELGESSSVLAEAFGPAESDDEDGESSVLAESFGRREPSSRRQKPAKESSGAQDDDLAELIDDVFVGTIDAKNI